MNMVLDSENTALLHAVLKGKKSLLTTGLKSSIFRLHIC